MASDAVAFLTHWFIPADSSSSHEVPPTLIAGLASHTHREQTLDTEDLAFLHRLHAGDDTAFDDWYLRDYPVVWKFALRFTHTRDSAEDLAQDVFAAVWHRRRTLDVRSNLRSYLLTAVRHRALNYTRDTVLRETKASAQPLAGLSQPAPSPSALAEATDMRARIRQALLALPERQRSALILRLEHELPNTEIARILDVGEAAVSRLITRAIDGLRRTLIK